MSKKLLAAVGGVAAAAALAVPGQANAQEPQQTLLVVKTQILQPSSGCSLLGTQGSWLLGGKLNICIART